MTANTPQDTPQSSSLKGSKVAEILVKPLDNLLSQWKAVKQDLVFWNDFYELLRYYAGRPTPLTEVPRFSAFVKGPRIFLKREDLLFTGTQKINNALGQCLLAQKMGKSRVITDGKASQDAFATATACARLGLECVVYVDEADAQKHQLNTQKMILLGAKIVLVKHSTVKNEDVISEALKDWSTNYANSYYCTGSSFGPNPYPEIVREFQAVVGMETQDQVSIQAGKAPDVLIAYVGGGSNAIGIFSGFIDQPKVQIIGVEVGAKEGSASLESHALSPQLAGLSQSGRVKLVSTTDEEALRAFDVLSKTEGIIASLESSHALAYTIKVAANFPKDAVIVVSLSGSGDKDLPQLFKTDYFQGDTH